MYAVLKANSAPCCPLAKFSISTKYPMIRALYFPVAGGRFIPREIITIPILNNDEVIAMISLACISKFNEHSY